MKAGSYGFVLTNLRRLRPAARPLSGPAASRADHSLAVFAALLIALLSATKGESWTTKAPMPTPRSNVAAGVVGGVLYVAGGVVGLSTLATLESYDPATDTWTTRAPMPTARSTFGMGVIAGVVYAIGGIASDGTFLATVEAYDPATNTWSPKAPMPTARWGLAVGVIGGVLYAVGGFNGVYLATVETYDPATNTWTTAAPMPTARASLGVGVINGVLYAVGGYNDEVLATVEAYDPVTNVWSTKTPMPAARAGLAVGVTSGVLHAVGGGRVLSFTELATLEAYDTATDAWTPKARMPSARTNLGAGVIDGVLYAVGGLGTVPGGSFTNSAATEAYDETTESWTPQASMPTARLDLAVEVVNGILYAVGGFLFDHLATVEAYDPVSNTWSSKAPMPTARRDLAAGVVNGVLYAVGGYNGSYLATMEAYDPASDTWSPRAPMPTARRGLAVGVVDGVLYAVGGYNGSDLATVEAYDPATDTWSTKAPMKTARPDLGVGVMSGVLYAVDANGKGSLEAYDPVSNTWSTRAPMPTARWGLAVGVVNGVLYAVGGYYVGTVEAYDPATDTWSTKGRMPSARAFLGVGAASGVLYAVGGATGGAGWAMFLADLEAQNAPPRATSVAINGTPTVGQLLAGNYVYVDDEGDGEGASSYRWLRDGTVLDGATDPTYLVSAPDLGRSLTFEVTPRAQTGGSSGPAVTSAPVVILDSAPSITITTPTIDPIARATRPFLALGGTAAGASPTSTGEPSAAMVTSVTWATDRGASGTAIGTEHWLAEIPLLGGTNAITVTATDATGVSASDRLTVSVPGFEYYLAEGATGSFFEEELVLANPNALAAPVTIRFLQGDGSTADYSLNVAAESRQTLLVNNVAGLDNTAVSAVVTSAYALPLAVERTMTWDATKHGSHTETATPGADLTWYFAEGSQEAFFETYLLLANPQSTPNRATVQFFVAGRGPVTKTYDLPPTSRANVLTGLVEDPPGTRVLVGKAFSIVVTFDHPGVAERAMYFGTAPFWSGGHASAGVNAPSTSWYHAEGATGGFFDAFLLLFNPNETMATVTLRFLLDSGTTVTRTKMIGAGSRLTVWLDGEDPLLANAALATEVTSDVPLVSERSMYWTQYPGWYEGHNAFGVTAPRPTWALAEGRVGGVHGFETYILLANPATSPAAVTMTYLREEGRPPIVQTHTVPAGSRFNVYANEVPGLLDGERFGALIESTVPIAVERAMYSNAESQSGLFWAAGTSATGTPMPRPPSASRR